MRWALVAVALVGCQERAPRAWDAPDAAGTVTLPPPMPPRPEDDPEKGSADAGAAPRPADTDEPALPVRVGGPWVRCYGHFKPSGDPAKDVVRLGLACGPSNGMRRLTTANGAVDAGGAAVEQRIDAKRGDCFRVFAVAEPSVGDLDVTLRSSRGSALARDHSEDAWPIVQPDRPVCALEDDRWTLEVKAARGKGRFALEVWSFAPAEPRR